MIVRDALFIGGSWVRPGAGDGVIEVGNAATEEVLGTVPDGGPADVGRGVGAARRGMVDWWGAAALIQRAIG